MESVTGTVVRPGLWQCKQQVTGEPIGRAAELSERRQEAQENEPYFANTGAGCALQFALQSDRRADQATGRIDRRADHGTGKTGTLRSTCAPQCAGCSGRSPTAERRLRGRCTARGTPRASGAATTKATRCSSVGRPPQSGALGAWMGCSQCSRNTVHMGRGFTACRGACQGNGRRCCCLAHPASGTALIRRKSSSSLAKNAGCV